MTETVGSRVRAETRQWREKGLSYRALEEMFGISEWTIQKWHKDVPCPRNAHPLKVDWHPANQCWHIYLYDMRKSGLTEHDPERGIHWWPEEWERFATKEAAEARLKAKEGAGASRPCSTTA